MLEHGKIFNSPLPLKMTCKYKKAKTLLRGTHIKIFSYILIIRI